MIILGLTFDPNEPPARGKSVWQDTAAALIVDGTVVSAINARKLRRMKKKTRALATVRYVLRDYGIKLNQVDKIAIPSSEESLTRRLQGVSTPHAYIRTRLEEAFATDINTVAIAFIDSPAVDQRNTASDAIEAALQLYRLESPAPQHTEVKFEPPGNETERVLVDTWQKTLSKGGVGIHDDFFRSGGDSLKAIRALSDIQKKLAVKIPLVEFYGHSTPATLAAYIKDCAPGQFLPLEAAEEREFYNVPFQVADLWLRYRYQVKDRRPFNVYGVYHLDQGGIDNEIMAAVWQTIVMRHENLRTTFGMVKGEPVMRVRPPVSHPLMAPFEYFDLRDLPATQREQTREKLVEERMREEFDLEKGPVCRATLIRTGEQFYTSLFVTHHIYSDEFSKGLMEKEFLTLLEAYGKGEKNPFPPLEIQFKDFAAWQCKVLEGRWGEGLRAFWHDSLGRDIPPSNLPMDYPGKRRKGTYRELLARDVGEQFRPLTPAEFNGLIGVLVTARSLPGASYWFAIDRERQEWLAGLALAASCPPLAVISAAFSILFYYFTGQEDSITGTIVITRRHGSLEKITGNFTNTLLYRLEVRPDLTVHKYTSYVGKTIASALEHDGYPLARVLEQLDTALDSIGTLSLNYINNENNRSERIEDFTPRHGGHDHVYFDMDFILAQCSNGISVTCNYNKNLFKPETIELISQRFQLLLDEMTRDSSVKIGDLRCLHRISNR